MPTTSTHSLTYPSSSDPVEVWNDIQRLADSVETALTAYETWTTWSLSWDTTTGGGFTSVGAGVSQGHYMRIGNFVHAEFRVELGAGFAVDTGTFLLMLPFTAYVWGGNVNNGVVGNWQARDTSATDHYGGPISIYQASSDRVAFAGAPPNAGGTSKNRVDSNDPIVWASGDILSGNMTYRAA